MLSNPYTKGAAAALGFTLLLAGCSSDQDELRMWMEQQQREIKPSVTALEPPKQFLPEAYAGLVGVEPFSEQKLGSPATTLAGQPNPVLASEMRRRKEPLEAYPLDTMNMVGSVRKEGRQFALLRVDNLLHYVKSGDYIGQDYGRITNISETGIQVREIVQDAAGEWVERSTELHLQDGTQ